MCEHAAQPDQRGRARPKTGGGAGAAPDDGPVVPSRSAADSDAAWGDDGVRSDEWYQSQRPPHHGSV